MYNINLKPLATPTKAHSLGQCDTLIFNQIQNTIKICLKLYMFNVANARALAARSTFKEEKRTNI